MVSRDLFNKMSILALVLIVLFGSLAFRSSAYEGDPEIEGESFNETYDIPLDPYLDSGIESAFTKDDAAAIRKDIATIRDNTATIRQNSDILIYFVFPVSFAAVIACKFIVWLLRTFFQ